jgi:hypothetical protein
MSGRAPGHVSAKYLSIIICLLAFCLTSCTSCNPNKLVQGTIAGNSGNAAADPEQSAPSHYERNEGKERVIVFVHGVYGSAAGTWTCAATGVTWPRLLLSDRSFANADI